MLQSYGDARGQQAARSQALRSVLLGTAAAGLMLFGYGRGAYAQVSPPAAPCNQISGVGNTTVTCTGDVSGGILVDGDATPYTTLNVNNIDRDISPGAGIDGLRFTNTNGNDITIVSDTGSHSIVTNDAYGLIAQSFQRSIMDDVAAGAATVTHTGNVQTMGDNANGLSARSQSFTLFGDATARAVTVTSTGNVETTGANADGIYALTLAFSSLGNATAGAATVMHTGDIETRGSSADGIYARILAPGQSGATAGVVTVTSAGNIETMGEAAMGIQVEINGRVGVPGNGITVSQTGSITTGGNSAHGIWARTVDVGDVAVIHDGAIRVTGNAEGTFRNAPRRNATGIQVTIFETGDAFVSTAARDGYASDQIYSKYGNAIYVSTGSGNASLEIANRLTGGAASYGGSNTVALDLRSVAGTNRVELQEGFGFNGIVDARNNGAAQPTGNRLVFGGPSGEGTFDLSQVSADLTEDAGEVFFGFDNVFLKEDQSNFIFEGQNQNGAEYEEADVTGGLALLASNGRIRMAGGATPFTVSGGGLGAIGDGGVLDGNVSLGSGGSIVLSNGGPFDSSSGLSGANDVLRIAGNFQSRSGAFYLDTFLNDGVVDITDTLVIGGDTSGTTRVFVSNTGGIGGFTGRGATDGIKIIDVAGDSNGSFVLGEDVIAGAFEYDLNQADGQDWFLQSHLRDIAVMAAYVPYTLQTLGRELTGTYYERTGTRIGWQDGNGSAAAGIVGETASSRANGGSAAEPLPSAGWVRALGSWSDADGSLLNGRNAVSYEEDFWAIQGGFDGVAYEDERGTLIASIFGQYANSDTDARNDFANRDAGTTDTEGWGGGLALTYAALNGLYLDGVTTYTSYDIALRSPRGDAASATAGNWTVSGEAGWQVAIGRNLAMTPQAQLLYQDVNVGDTIDSRGVQSVFTDTESLEGRIGTTLEYTTVMNGVIPAAMSSSVSNSAMPVRLYGEFNVVHEFLDSPAAIVGGTALDLGFEETGYEVGGGLEIGEKGGGLAYWVEGDYRAPFDIGDGIQSWAVTGGVAYRF